MSAMERGQHGAPPAADRRRLELRAALASVAAIAFEHYGFAILH